MVVVAGLKIRIPTYPNFLPVYKRVSKANLDLIECGDGDVAFIRGQSQYK